MDDTITDLMPYMRESRAMLPDTLRLGPVRLAVTDLNRAVDFYGDVIGLQVSRRGIEGVYNVAHLSAGGPGMEDVVVLQHEPGARSAREHARHSGLYHVALNYPTRLELARTARRIVETRTPIQGASNHKTHEAIYLADPDGNGLELAWDFPREQWPTTLARLFSEGRGPLDWDGLLALTAGESALPAAPGLRVGHLHLHVGNLPRARNFYVDLLGFELQMDVGNAAFTSAGRYHHHLGFNTWRGEGAGPAPADVAGLREWRIYLPDSSDVDAARMRLEAGGVHVTFAGSDAFTTADPWGIPLYVGLDPAR